MQKKMIGRLNAPGKTPAPAVAPVTRAIRSALSISATLLALGSSGSAIAANTCVFTAPTTETCEGAFSATLPGKRFTPVDDLTLVLGDSKHKVPTSVTPGANTRGVDAHWKGNVGITSFADITTVGATGIFAYGSTSATVNNAGSIGTIATHAHAQAMDISAQGNVTVINSGDVSVHGVAANDATAISAYSSKGSVTATNSVGGTITAKAQDGNAIGLNTSSPNGSGNVYNDGAISASSDNGVAVGLLTTANGFSFVMNEGSIKSASATSQSIGLLASNANYLIVHNDGSIVSTSGGDQSFGLEAYGASGSIVYNTGSIVSDSTGGASTGVTAHKIINSGSVEATGTHGQVVGILATANYATVVSTGKVTTTGDGAANAVGIAAYSRYGSNIKNSGTVSAVTTSSSLGGTATGILAETHDVSPGFGTAIVTNSGQVTATTNTTSSSIDGTATGILAQTYKGGASVTSSKAGSIAASAQGYNNAIGINANSTFSGNAVVKNAGSISADARIADATGITASAHYGSSSVNNSGAIDVLTTGKARTSAFDPNQRDYAVGIVAASGAGTGGGLSSVINSGSIRASGNRMAEGIQASARDGLVSVTTTASSAITVTGDQFAIGIGTGRNGYDSFGEYFDNHTHDAVIANAGSIKVTATYRGGPFYYHAHAFGIEAYLRYGNDVSVTNSGDISVSLQATGAGAGFSTAVGIEAATRTGDLSINNSGHLSVDTTGITYGISARSSSYGDVSVDNSGSLSVASKDGVALGMNVRFDSDNGTVGITNSGDIAVTGATSARGIYGRYLHRSRYYGDGNVVLHNSGTINASIVNGNSAFSLAFGAQITSAHGDTTIVNSGAISAKIGADPTGSAAYGAAVGVDATDFHDNYNGDGKISVTNSGSISASVVSNGRIHGYLQLVPVTAAGILAVPSYGSSVVINSGVVSASGETDATAKSGSVITNGIRTINNAYYPGDSVGHGDMGVTNTRTGRIEASSASNFGNVATSATGIFASLGMQSTALVKPSNGITIDNAGRVSATAVVGGTDTLGSASATGIDASIGSHGFLHLKNTGVVRASATSSAGASATGVSATSSAGAAGTGVSATSSPGASATGASAKASQAEVTLDAGSVVDAIATGSSGSATGLSVAGASVSASNAGQINASFIGTGGNALGVVVASAGDVRFANTGSILASGASAVGIDLESATRNSLDNRGTVSAFSASVAGVAVKTGDAAATMTNSGLINGTLQTGAGDDTFTNAASGVWNAAGSSSFGGGSNTLNNAGLLVFDNSTLDLTAAAVKTQRIALAQAALAAATNVFNNTGTIRAEGASLVHLGGGTLTNNGVIDFQNGIVGDTLAVAGNFAGSGVINADVSGLHGTADQLQITGDVAANTRTTVNVRVLDDPTQATTIVPLVTVAGISAANNFVLGTIVQDKSFLQLDGTLVTGKAATSSATVSPAAPPPPVITPPVTTPPATTPPETTPPATTPETVPVQPSGGGIGIGIGVSGLSNLGTLAASAAPGAQSLMSSEIGTFQDRLGAIKQSLKGGLSLWARVFGDSGKVDPSHSAGNFGQGGNFAFDQNNEGQELGLDFAITDELKAGLLLSKNEASQHLTDGNYGSARIRSTTGGIYATWVAESGLYVDASFRAMSFNSRLTAASGQAWINGNANAFNVEAGQSFTIGNDVQLAPQFQYTWDKVEDVKSETASLAGFQSRGAASSRARLGLMVSKSYNASDKSTVWTPYASLSAVHEFDGDSRYSINSAFDGQTSTRGTSALVEGGINVTFNKVALYGGLNWLDGGAQKSFFGGQVGVRYSW